ncbi:hypothetical protein F5X96DRAFT_627905 [Biscogniauxia mediterranea]|nr:hypothetical protein F5X96DRAFT_627905 [Biscogniauxia mediterranea]
MELRGDTWFTPSIYIWLTRASYSFFLPLLFLVSFEPRMHGTTVVGDIGDSDAHAIIGGVTYLESSIGFTVRTPFNWQSRRAGPTSTALTACAGY